MICSCEHLSNATDEDMTPEVSKVTLKINSDEALSDESL